MTRVPRRRTNSPHPAAREIHGALVPETATVSIVSLNRDGNGVGTLAEILEPQPEAESPAPPHAKAARVTVPFTAPGDTVRVRLWRRDSDGAAADLLEVVTPATERVPAPCPLFGQCGGCQLQHLSYEAQLAWKTAVVRELAIPLALGDHVAGCVGSPRRTGYRSKITPHYDRPRADRPLAIGFLKVGQRHQVIDVERCVLATDAINAHLPAFRAEIAASAANRRLGASFLIREAASGVTTDPDARVTEQVGALKLEFFAREFFQNNPFLLPNLIQFVVEAAAARAASLLVDTYSGSGLFALSAASRFAHVIGVEVSPGAVRAARENASRNGITNARFLAADSARIFNEIDHASHDAAVVIDPPRKGCGDVFLAQLVAFAPATIVYVSCNPETLCRDLDVLIKAGYAVTTLQPFDMFPQTRHVECVAVLVRSPVTPLDASPNRNADERSRF